MGSINVGDVLFQLIALLMVVLLISGIGMLIKRAVASDRRLKRIEEKVDRITEKKRRERP
ncbi:DUF4083 family protein [Fictibacillus nanhaiensis]|uniref:DUF4083 family protein n=1 Tax=Fictibacillus nanhaiensis TaxID=742169 RepID=UPI001C98A96F|nr:DUF4083 family protein [Fictibacillus nanhaiensis]MBY6037013.1 DUF4083 family protein [Fictibacillus nanhaiensis]